MSQSIVEETKTTHEYENEIKRQEGLHFETLRITERQKEQRNNNKNEHILRSIEI